MSLTTAYTRALRPFSTAAARPPTAIVMMNLGGPETLDKVNPFLERLFTDKEIIDLGTFQNTIGPFIAKRRTSSF